MKKPLADFTLEELKELAASLGEKPYRAGQLYKWVHSGASYAEMSDLPSAFRDALAAEYSDCAVEKVKKLVSKDGTAKYLFRLSDGNIIESVFMRYRSGNTVCISTQVGCRMNCAFCASGIDGLLRNLSAGEILSQVTAVNRDQGGTLRDKAVSNIVLMGSGEPLDNYENLTRFIDLATSKEGFNISQRSISLSTCGLADKMKRLADDGYSVNMTVSLHATTDETRSAIMPVNKSNNIARVMDAARYYFEKTGRRIMIEYTLIAGQNMTDSDALRLKELCRGMSCHINLILLNPVKEKNLKSCTRADAETFKERLESLNLTCTVRRSLGSDIEGACGQLRNKFVGDNKPKN